MACGPVDTGSGTLGPGSTDGGPISGAGDGGTDSGVDAGFDAGTGSDGGTDAGTLAGCDGVVPASTPAPHSVTVPHTANKDVCFYSTTDEQGTIAAESHSTDDNARWQLWAPGGAVSGSFSASVLLFGMPSGFAGTRRAGNATSLVRFSSTGQETSRTDLFGGAGCTGTAFLAVPGGTLVLGGCGSSLNATRFDTAGRPVTTRTIVDKAVSAVGLVDAAGRTLIVAWPGSDVGVGSRFAGRWFDTALAPTSAWFELPGTGDVAPFVRPLIGGGAAMQVGGSWIATIASNAASWTAPPAWLASRPLHDFQIIRQGRAYALIAKFGAAAPRNVLELVTPEGEKCGVGTFPGEGLAVTMDGTVIASGGEGGCDLTWWTGALR